MYVRVYRGERGRGNLVYFKDLGHVIVGAGNSEICGAGGQAGGLPKTWQSCLVSAAKGCVEADFLSQGPASFLVGLQLTERGPSMLQKTAFFLKCHVY